MRPRRRMLNRPRVVGVPVVSGCGCARSNGDTANNVSPIVGLGILAGVVAIGWFMTKEQRDAKIEKDRAIAQAIREGKVSNLNLSQTEANVTGYGMSF